MNYYAILGDLHEALGLNAFLNWMDELQELDLDGLVRFALWELAWLEAHYEPQA